MPEPMPTPIAQAAQAADSALAQLSDTIARTIDVLSAKLGPPADLPEHLEHLAHFITVRTVGTVAVLWTAFVLFCVVGAVAAKRAQRAAKESVPEALSAAVLIISVLGAIITLITGIVRTPCAVATMVDPVGALISALLSGRVF